MDDPTIVVRVNGDDIRVVAQNALISLQNSVVADLAPFLESPFPSDPKSEAQIRVSVRNVSATLLPDAPSLYPESFMADLAIDIEQLDLRLDPDGKIIRSMTRLGRRRRKKGKIVPQAPPRASIMTRTA